MILLIIAIILLSLLVFDIYFIKKLVPFNKDLSNIQVVQGGRGRTSDKGPNGPKGRDSTVPGPQGPPGLPGPQGPPGQPLPKNALLVQKPDGSDTCMQQCSSQRLGCLATLWSDRTTKDCGLLQRGHTPKREYKNDFDPAFFPLLNMNTNTNVYMDKCVCTALDNYLLDGITQMATKSVMEGATYFTNDMTK
jgi:hypothetical protein